MFEFSCVILITANFFLLWRLRRNVYIFHTQAAASYRPKEKRKEEPDDDVIAYVNNKAEVNLHILVTMFVIYANDVIYHKLQICQKLSQIKHLVESSIDTY